MSFRRGKVKHKMDMVVVLIKQNLVMMIYLLIGYFLYRGKLVTETGSGELGKILLYVIMPVAIVKSYIKDFSVEILEGFGISFLAAVISLGIAILLSRWCFGRRKHQESKSQGNDIEHFGAAFSNAGFIGIPLVQMVLGEEAVLYISSFVAILNILQWTYGVAVMNGNRKNITVKKIVTNPIVISFAVGLTIFFFSIKIPEMATGMLGTIASMNGPLAMIVLGIYLAQIPLGELFTDKAVYKCAAVRLILIPIVTLLALSLIPEKYLFEKLAVLIAAAAPVGANVAIFAQMNGRDYTQAVKDVCLSTILCIVTMPAIIGFSNFIW